MWKGEEKEREGQNNHSKGRGNAIPFFNKDIVESNKLKIIYCSSVSLLMWSLVSSLSVREEECNTSNVISG
jgi:hypothetical protein